MVQKSGVDMDAPKCSVCGRGHWSNEPHKWEDEPKKGVISKLRGVVGMANKVVDHMANVPSVANKPMANTDLLANGMANSRSSSMEEQRFCKPKVEGSIPSSGSTYKYRDTEKRKAYQREYMRMVRAKNK